MTTDNNFSDCSHEGGHVGGGAEAQAGEQGGDGEAGGPHGLRQAAPGPHTLPEQGWYLIFFSANVMCLLLICFHYNNFVILLVAGKFNGPFL